MADEIISDSEEWRTIEGWPSYEVSDQGRVRRALPAYRIKNRPCILFPAGHLFSPSLDSKGYRRTSFRSKGVRKHFNISVLVCRAFHGPKPTPRHEVAHGNGVRTDDRADNLRWATMAENEADKENHGTRARGERHGNAIFCDEDILAIRSRLALGENCTQIASSYRCSIDAIWQIKAGHRWAHVK